jgi:hypothetical protein
MSPLMPIPTNFDSQISPVTTREPAKTAAEKGHVLEAQIKCHSIFTMSRMYVEISSGFPLTCRDW